VAAALPTNVMKSRRLLNHLVGSPHCLVLKPRTAPYHIARREQRCASQQCRLGFVR